MLVGDKIDTIFDRAHWSAGLNVQLPIFFARTLLVWPPTCENRPRRTREAILDPNRIELPKTNVENIDEDSRENIYTVQRRQPCNWRHVQRVQAVDRQWMTLAVPSCAQWQYLRNLKCYKWIKTMVHWRLWRKSTDTLNVSLYHLCKGCVGASVGWRDGREPQLRKQQEV